MLINNTWVNYVRAILQFSFEILTEGRVELSSLNEELLDLQFSFEILGVFGNGR